MILSHDALIKLVLDSKALSIWNRLTGPVFWYTMGVPGPFFLNTEYLIGADIAKELVASITTILTDTPDPATRAARIKKVVMESYHNNPVYKNLIETMVAKANEVLAPGSYTLVSGGERRDWIFSIPFAEETGLRHVYIFKDKSSYCESPLGENEKALHIADLINNAASYVEKWLPALEKAKIAIDTTLCVDTRGSVGINTLKEKRVAIICLFSIDLPFFEKSMMNGLIDRATYDELASFYSSEPAWAEKYLMGNETVFNVAKTDAKTFPRLQSFFTADPWQLRDRYPDFFKAIQTAIENRQKEA